ncbi:hydrogenase maturation protease [Rhodoferax sp. 4810]|uniref:Hydrogenase maturation protease n=2 Tax=Thiospirillum jenense TaxID=1653858 RepID=A0A839HC45_9GAMM|nr:hydrogenase maturation protease [Rhodoferax jenense]MBB1126523.1 hydrogenase maturation protease [Thiospirillum jenense]
MTRILIIGYGNPIRGDDAIGPLVADQLSQCALPPGVKVIARHILTAELIAEFAELEQVIFLDAAINGIPGTVQCQCVTAEVFPPVVLGHFQTPTELLAWCAALYGRTPQAWLITAVGAEFNYMHYQLSPQAQAAVNPMIAEVMALLNK